MCADKKKKPNIIIEQNTQNEQVCLVILLTQAMYILLQQRPQTFDPYKLRKFVVQGAVGDVSPA